MKHFILCSVHVWEGSSLGLVMNFYTSFVKKMANAQTHVVALHTHPNKMVAYQSCITAVLDVVFLLIM